jgi:sec-independent protein translocase protein TatA
MEGLFQPMHLLVILVIVLLIFGPKKLGELGKGLGEGIKNFKSSMNDGNATKTTPPATTAPPPVVPAPPTPTTPITAPEEKK